MTRIRLLLALVLWSLARVASAQSQTDAPGLSAVVVPLIVTGSSIGTTSTDGIVLQNVTPATVGVPVQMSPRMKWCGTAYNSVSTLSETDCFIAENLPSTAAGTTTGLFKIGYISPSGVLTYPFTITSTGNFTTLGAIKTGSGQGIGWSGVNSFFVNGADGQVDLWNNAQTEGIGLDVTTNNTLAVRNTSQNAYATVAASAYQLGTAIVASSTAPTVTSGFGSGSAGTMTAGSTTFAFRITVGTNAGGTTGVIGLPTATTFWNCTLKDQSTPADLTNQTSSTTSAITFTTTVAWTTGDILLGTCSGS